MQKRDSFKDLQYSPSYCRKGTNGNTATKLCYRGQQEKPTFLVSMLLLCMLGINVASIRIPANFF